GVRVLQHVVEEAGGDGGEIHLEVHEEAGDLEGVRDVRLAGRPLLTLVRALGELVGALEQREIGARLILRDVLDQLLELGPRAPLGLTIDHARPAAAWPRRLRGDGDQALAAALRGVRWGPRLHSSQSSTRVAAAMEEYVPVITPTTRAKAKSFSTSPPN